MKKKLEEERQKLCKECEDTKKQLAESLKNKKQAMDQAEKYAKIFSDAWNAVRGDRVLNQNWEEARYNVSRLQSGLDQDMKTIQNKIKIFQNQYTAMVQTLEEIYK